MERVILDKEIDMKIGFIGCGNMGGTLAHMLSQGSHEIYVCDHNESKVEKLHNEDGCIISTTKVIAKECELIFLGVKPQAVAQVAQEIANEIDLALFHSSHVTIVSMAAGISLLDLTLSFGPIPLIRIMPTMTTATGEGIVLYCANKKVDARVLNAFSQLIEPLGLSKSVDESSLDTYSALVGCGPAFVHLMMESFIDAGIRLGIPRDQARDFTIQTFLGSALHAKERQCEPSELRYEVCSPGGTTIEGIYTLERNALRAAIYEALEASCNKTKKLGAVSQE